MTACSNQGPDPAVLTGYPPWPALPKKAVLGAGSPAWPHICSAVRATLISKGSFLHHPRLSFEHCIINCTQGDKLRWKGTAPNILTNLLTKERPYFCKLFSSPQQSSWAAWLWTVALPQISSFSPYSISQPPSLYLWGSRASWQGAKQCSDSTFGTLKCVGSKLHYSMKSLKRVCSC